VGETDVQVTRQVVRRLLEAPARDTDRFGMRASERIDPNRGADVDEIAAVELERRSRRNDIAASSFFP